MRAHVAMCVLAVSLCVWPTAVACAGAAAPGGSDAPQAAAAASLPPMLRLAGAGEDPAAIDFTALDVLPGEHAVVTSGDAEWQFRLHNYLVRWGDRYWCMWSHGPVIEDHPRQHVRCATSADGLVWSAAQPIMEPSPREGFRYIARGFWVREGRLLALASHDEAFDERGRVRFFGPSLELRAWEWDDATGVWRPLGRIAGDAINNFPPRRMPGGEWGMLCRDHRRRVSLLIGGVEGPWSWTRIAIADYGVGGSFRPEEPDWWPLSDGRLLAVFRDNAGSRRLFRSVSSDGGHSWSAPEPTNFPDATSKFFCLATSRGFHVLVSNANPAGRRPLCVATSSDGVTFTRLGRLPFPERHAGVDNGGVPSPDGAADTLQYPHAIEHDGRLLVACSRNKQRIEVVRISLDDLPAPDEIGPAAR